MAAKKKKSEPASVAPKKPAARTQKPNGRMVDVHLMMPPKLIKASKQAASLDAKTWSEWVRHTLWRAAQRRVKVPSGARR